MMLAKPSACTCKGCSMHTAHLIQSGQAGRGKRWAAVYVIQRTVKIDYKGEGPLFLWKTSFDG